MSWYHGTNQLFDLLTPHHPGHTTFHEDTWLDLVSCDMICGKYHIVKYHTVPIILTVPSSDIIRSVPPWHGKVTFIFLSQTSFWSTSTLNQSDVVIKCHKPAWDGWIGSSSPVREVPLAGGTRLHILLTALVVHTIVTLSCTTSLRTRQRDVMSPKSIRILWG